MRFRSFDGDYTESLPLDVARASDTMVALQMLGGPVSHDHGGPVRMYVTASTATRAPSGCPGSSSPSDEMPGYWEHRGYAVDGTIRE